MTPRAVAAAIPLQIHCALCGRPYTVTLPVHTEPVDGWLRVVVDDETLSAAVRAHCKQHAN